MSDEEREPGWHWKHNACGSSSRLTSPSDTKYEARQKLKRHIREDCDELGSGNEGDYDIFLVD